MKIFGKKIAFWLLIPMVLCADYIRDDDKNIVIDTSTKLMWQDDGDANSTTATWSDAITYCEAKSLGGFDDWRLPNINELFSLIDISKTIPMISSKFKYIPTSNDPAYWSSTTNKNDNTSHYYIKFSPQFEMSGELGGNNSYYTRCVRGGQ